ncbi:MAG: hypothetical protein ACKO37_07180 [Vampirovibrionales bacterium]
MDFSVIQQFFTRMQCQVCDAHLHKEGIELLKEEHGTYLVNLHCTTCDTQMGVAVVSAEKASSLKDMLEDETLPQHGATLMLEMDKTDLSQLLGKDRLGLSSFETVSSEDLHSPDGLAALLKGLQAEIAGDSERTELPTKFGELIAQALAPHLPEAESEEKSPSEVSSRDASSKKEAPSPEMLRLQKARKRVKYPKRLYDPELTPLEKERLSQYAPITSDDVLEAHSFFQSLGKGWMNLIPQEMRQ